MKYQDGFLSILLHARAPFIGGMDGDVKSDLATLSFKNREKLEDFYSRILRIQQKTNLSVETVSPTIFIFHCIKVLSKNDKIKSFLFIKMTDLTTFLEKNGKLSIYVR